MDLGTSVGNGSDTFTGIERVDGSTNDDNIRGRDLGDDFLWGGRGNDLLDGRGGNDDFSGASTDADNLLTCFNDNDTIIVARVTTPTRTSVRCISRARH